LFILGKSEYIKWLLCLSVTAFPLNFKQHNTVSIITLCMNISREIG